MAVTRFYLMHFRIDLLQIERRLQPFFHSRPQIGRQCAEPLGEFSSIKRGHLVADRDAGSAQRGRAGR